MTIERILLLTALLGQGALAIGAMNWVHGLGLRFRRIDAVTAGILLLVMLSGVGVVGWYWSVPLAGWPRVLVVLAVLAAPMGVVYQPLAALKRGLRRPPHGVSGRTTPCPLLDDENKEIGWGMDSWFLRLPGNESLSLVRADWTLRRPGLPQPLDGMTIVLLTDLHFSQAYDLRYFEAVADQAAECEADLVLFGGDLIDDPVCHDWIVPVLSRVRGRLGSFAVLGNHDRWFDTDKTTLELNRAGYEVLDGRWTRLDVAGARLAIGGTSAPWGPRPDPAQRPEADATILLSHSPDLFPRAASWGVDLMFSGHNHAGQVRVPGIGPILMPSVYSRRFDRGFFTRGRTLLYVGQGIGAKHPLRYGCPPELATFTLRVPRARSPHHARGARLHESVSAISIPPLGYWEQYRQGDDDQ